MGWGRQVEPSVIIREKTRHSLSLEEIRRNGWTLLKQGASAVDRNGVCKNERDRKKHQDRVDKTPNHGQYKPTGNHSRRTIVR